MIVCLLCYDWNDWFQQIPLGDFSREGLTASKVGVKIWTLIGESCLGLLQTKQCRASMKKKKIYQISMKKIKQVVL
jgi:hypothetical protein